MQPIDDAPKYKPLISPGAQKTISTVLGISAVALLIIGGIALIVLGKLQIHHFPKKVAIPFGAFISAAGLSVGVYWAAVLGAKLARAPTALQLTERSINMEANFALIDAVEKGDTDGAEKALAEGADIHVKNLTKSLLDIARELNDGKMETFLLRKLLCPIRVLDVDD